MSAKCDPHQTETSNSPYVETFTCPACYSDLGGTNLIDETTQCSCGWKVECTVEYAPIYKTHLVEDDDENEHDIDDYLDSEEAGEWMIDSDMGCKG